MLFLFTTFSSADVLKIVVNDAIQPVTAEYIGRALDLAAANHDQAVLIEINTPGGLVDSTRDIIEKIVASPVPVIVYVTPSRQPCRLRGNLHPRGRRRSSHGARNQRRRGPSRDSWAASGRRMMKKMENDAAALMRSVVAKRGRNVELAESAVRESKSFTDQEALDKKLIEYIAPSDAGPVTPVEREEFQTFNGTTVTLILAGEPVRDYRMTLKQRILSYIMDPNVAFILLAIGALRCTRNSTIPARSFLEPWAWSSSCLAAFALEPAARPLRGPCHDLGAFALFAAEAKFASHGVLTTGGIVLSDPGRTASGRRARSPKCAFTS